MLAHDWVGDSGLDLYPFLGLCFAFPLSFLLLSFLIKSRLSAVFPFFGAIIGGYGFLGLGTDGNLTTNYTGTANTLVAAANNNFTWIGLTLVPLSLTLICFLFAGYKAVKKG